MVGRLTVVEDVYYQASPSEEPMVASDRYVREVSSGEQVYERRLRLGPNWTPLDLGWLMGQPISSILIRNEEGRNLPVNPTEEERAAVALRVVEVALREVNGFSSSWLVVPGESMRGVPHIPGNLMARCYHGPAVITVFAFPG